jgi:hypothetical protein
MGADGPDLPAGFRSGRDQFLQRRPARRQLEPQQRDDGVNIGAGAMGAMEVSSLGQEPPQTLAFSAGGLPIDLMARTARK